MDQHVGVDSTARMDSMVSMDSAVPPVDGTVSMPSTYWSPGMDPAVGRDTSCVGGAAGDRGEQVE